MPTDGADFGKSRGCYGKAFSMARDGAGEAAIADCILKGVEREIKWDGGAPAFRPAVELLVIVTGNHAGQEILLSGADTIKKQFADSPLTRHLAEAAEKLGLSSIHEGCALSPEQASEKLLVKIAEGRCCDDLVGYVARNRTKDLVASQRFVDSIEGKFTGRPTLGDLATRMRNCSTKGLPARAPKTAPLAHTAEGNSPDLQNVFTTLLRRHSDEWHSFMDDISPTSIAA